MYKRQLLEKAYSAGTQDDIHARLMPMTVAEIRAVVDRCSEAGIVVFNTPGANANAVKELVIAALLIASRDILGGAEWVLEQAHTPKVDLVSAVVSWNIDSGDWLLNGADEQVSTVLDSVTPGNIVLLTDRDECAEQTLEALPQIIDGLIADGYKIVTLSDLVKTDTSLSKKLTSLTKVTMPKDAVFPQLAEDDDTTE